MPRLKTHLAKADARHADGPGSAHFATWALYSVALLSGLAGAALLGCFRFIHQPEAGQRRAVQPDLVFIAAANRGIIQRRGIFGIPDLLVEIVSPTTVRRDRYDKRELYARFGVKEYWIADPANRALEILTLKEGRYELYSSAEEKGQLRSLVLAGLEFDLSELGTF